MVTIKEIAEKAHVSTAAVSRALRNDESLSIAPETRSRILAIAAELGYVRPDQGSSANTTKNILIVHKHQTFRNQIDSSYYFAVRSGIEDICAKARVGYQFVALEDLTPKNVHADGIVVVGNYTQRQYTDFLSAFRNLPVVVVGIVAYYRSRFDHISYSNFESVSLALKHLFECGHTRIGYLGIEEAVGTEIFGSRKSAFISIMKEQGEYRPEWLLESDHGTDRVEQGFHMAQKLCRLKELPTAIFCANDPIALGAINGFTEYSIKIPEDISIVAHDGSYPTQYSFPPLTTVDVHPYILGSEAMELLLQRLAKPLKYTKEIMIYPTLIKRGSVKQLAATPRKTGGSGRGL